VQKLHVGVSEGWEGICLDRYTAHWTPYPLIVEGIELVTIPSVAEKLAVWQSAVPSSLLEGLKVKYVCVRVLYNSQRARYVDGVGVRR